MDQSDYGRELAVAAADRCFGVSGGDHVLDVEGEYDRYWRSVGGAARIRRTVSLYESFRRILEHQVRKSNPGLSDREVMIKAARRMYLSDKAAQRLLDQMENASCSTSNS